MRNLKSVCVQSFLTAACIGALTLSGCATDVDNNSNSATASKLVENTGQQSAAVDKIESSAAQTNQQEEEKAQTPTPKKEVPRKLHKGSSYFSFPKNSPEAQLADFIDSPKEVAPKSFDLESIVFAKNDSKLTKEAKKQLDNVSKVMAAYYGTKYDLYVPTGGGVSKTLAKKRANAVREYFIKKGLNGQSISIVGNAAGSSALKGIELAVTDK